MDIEIRKNRYINRHIDRDRLLTDVNNNKIFFQTNDEQLGIFYIL